MKILKQLLLVAVIIPFIAACSGKYSYESVEGDPMNSRIYTLDNGLKIYLTVNSDAPRIQTYIAVKVGAKNDPKETTGLAHYFEHLMFKGSKNFGTSDYEKEKAILDQIEVEFEKYRTLTDENERNASYKIIDSCRMKHPNTQLPMNMTN